MTPQTQRRPVAEVARPTGDALASLEEMFRQAGMVAHELLDQYDTTTEPRDDDRTH